MRKCARCKISRPREDFRRVDLYRIYHHCLSCEPLVRGYGTGTMSVYGYRVVRHNGKSVHEHRVIAEKALGKPLPSEAVVHHWDKDRTNNRNDNLLICPDVAYHNLIHRRMDAMEATGDPNKRKCEVCNAYDDEDALVGLGARNRMAHRECVRRAGRIAYARKVARLRGDGDGKAEADAETASV